MKRIPDPRNIFKLSEESVTGFVEIERAVHSCRVSVVPAGDRGIVRRTGGRIYRLPGSGVAGKPLRTAAGGLLADGTGGGL